ncbi:hypothetical protein BCR34DRAFT_204946 [Clohesyomyces aquaticus]|uniref:Uncharacterized protein n=1 Tax=Clohesyomyces aquaticus TaxID=1231657 RepID=A0A1Y1YAK1_9PLEO|nr:hypothetical protein BCR34DRAFT_204946 [Clohesyomyces aquaticus]
MESLHLAVTGTGAWAEWFLTGAATWYSLFRRLDSAGLKDLLPFLLGLNWAAIDAVRQYFATEPKAIGSLGAAITISYWGLLIVSAQCLAADQARHHRNRRRAPLSRSRSLHPTRIIPRHIWGTEQYKPPPGEKHPGSILGRNNIQEPRGCLRQCFGFGSGHTVYLDSLGLLAGLCIFLGLYLYIQKSRIYHFELTYLLWCWVSY